MNLSILLLLTLELIHMSYGHLLPEDSENDEAEQLNREKRDDFLNDILKTIPFFNAAPSQGALNDEDDPNYTEEDFLFTTASSSSLVTATSSSVSLINTISESLNITSMLSSRSYILSATVATTAASFSINKTTIQLSKTPSLFSSTVMRTESSNIFSPSTVPGLSTKPTTVTTMVTITPTKSMYKRLTTSLSYSYPTASSSAVMMPISSAETLPSSSMIILSSAIADESQQIIKMMIMSAEDPLRNYGSKLPDEMGYGDTLVHIQTDQTNDESDNNNKNIRYLYANVLIPVMSGIFGALLITFGIILYKCIRRSKLQKVRYYGGKPNSALYRVDQMSLLSELTSDEED